MSIEILKDNYASGETLKAADINKVNKTINTITQALDNDPNFAVTVDAKIDKKVDKVDDKQLSTNDFTNDYKLKIDNLETTIDEKIADKQDVLISGRNIKTINNQSILGEGNIVIEGGSGGNINIDQIYNPKSENAQSGIAVAQAVENLEEKEILTTTEFNNISANGAVVEGVKVSGGLFNADTEGLLRIGTNDTNYNSQLRSLALNDGNKIITLPKGRYEITYDYQVLSGEFKTYENASVVFGSCLRNSWASGSWQTTISGFSAIAPDIYNGIRYEDRYEQMGIYNSESDLVDFSCYELDTWYSIKDTFEITEDNSIIVISAKNMTNWVCIKNIIISEISDKTASELTYSEVNKAPNSQAIWDGMRSFVNDTAARTQQHAHNEIKALNSLYEIGEPINEYFCPIVGMVENVLTGGNIFKRYGTNAAGDWLKISPDRNTYSGSPKSLILTSTSLKLMSLPKGTYIVKYKWRQQGRTPETFVNFDQYCNKMPYLKFVNQLYSSHARDSTAGIDISGNLLKYQGNYWANRWYEDSYTFTIDDSNYGGYFGIKCGYLQGDVHIANIQIYELKINTPIVSSVMTLNNQSDVTIIPKYGSPKKMNITFSLRSETLLGIHLTLFEVNNDLSTMHFDAVNQYGRFTGNISLIDMGEGQVVVESKMPADYGLSNNLYFTQQVTPIKELALQIFDGAMDSQSTPVSGKIYVEEIY